jgi:hypothetical protein
MDKITLDRLKEDWCELLWGNMGELKYNQLICDIESYGQSRYEEGTKLATDLQGKEIVNHGTVTDVRLPEAEIEYCEWVLDERSVNKHYVYCEGLDSTFCYYTSYIHNAKFCPFCGKRIKIKD